MEASTHPHPHAPRGSSPSRSSRSRSAGLGYLRFAPDAGPVSVPAGAQAGDLILKPCTLRAPRTAAYAADCGTLVVPENRADPQSRLIALPVTRIQRPLGASGGADLPPRGRSRHHEHGLREGEPLRRRPRRRPRRLPRRRRLVGARLPGGRVGAQALRRLPRREVLPAPTPTPSARARHRLQADGVDLAGYTLPQRVDDLEAARARPRLRPHRPAQRERRHAHGDDLLLAPPGEHPPLGDDRRQPARPLPLGRRRRPTSRSAATPTSARRTTTCRRRTDDLAASMRRTAADIPDRWGFLPIKQGNVRRRLLLRPHGVDVRGGAALRADDARLVALGRARATPSGFWFHVAARRPRLPRRRSCGATWRPSAGRRPAARRATSRRPGTPGLDPRQHPGTEFIWAGGAAGRRLAGQRRTRTSTPRADVGRRDAPDRRRARLRDAAAGTRRSELLPHLPNGHQVVLPGLGHTTDFWTLPARGQHPADQHVPRQRQGRRLALRATATSTSRRRSTQTAHRQGHRSARWSASPLLAVLSLLLDGRGACAGAAASGARPARCCARSTRSCSASAAGSSAP